ncbi:MAG: YybH family protein [Gemmatimonadaceae bacterium]
MSPLPTTEVRMKYWISIVSIVLAACSGSRSQGAAADSSASTATFTSADSSAIVALLNRMQGAARAGNWDAWGAEYTADPVRMPPNAPTMVGKAAADAFNNAAPKFSTFDVKVTSVVGNGDLAVATGTFIARAPAGKDSAGKATPAFNEDGKFMQSLRKQSDGSWKVERDIWNSNLPARSST